MTSYTSECDTDISSDSNESEASAKKVNYELDNFSNVIINEENDQKIFWW